jgi:DNA-binding SARP family transcriptional activator
MDDLAAFLGATAQEELHALSAHPHADVRRAVNRYLAEHPFPPRLGLRLQLLGPLELRRGGDVVDDAAWRRERVRTLLLYLVEHGAATREQLAGQLWPDLDERAAANNLRVTLSYLLAVLEPDRAAGDASWFVRTEGNTLRLVTGTDLWIDRAAFEAKLDEAVGYARDGAHSLELAALEEALTLWRGEPFVELPYDEWAELARVRSRQRYVEAALRAAELHGSAGDRSAAVRHARAALAVEPWSERAFRVLIAAALAAGDRAGALRALEECRTMLADLGLAPSPQTVDLASEREGGSALPGPAAG